MPNNPTSRRHPTQVAQDREHAIDVGKLRGLLETLAVVLDFDAQDGTDAQWSGLLCAATNVQAEFPGLIDEVERLRGALEGIFDHLDRPFGAPGHSHTMAGIWDDDVSNGDKAGKPCGWCAHWEQARLALGRGVGRG